ncbi:M28 family metallopeptidase [Candidatus Palauibacter sp.]|uniref:M28 family metallopeptidase n=1 Tax=Candidatus Palauibacter sp. TaxID=3101350 RepID=UPI003C6F56E7
MVPAGCAPDPEAPADALQGIDDAGLREHIAVLASDEFEGRAPVSRGEELTIAYLAEAFGAAGLEPGSDGEWLQPVPLVSITADPAMRLAISGDDGEAALAYGTEMMAWTKRVIDRSGLADSELVFVGYGIVAPEYGWDDYAEVDVTGKTVVMLVNDPGYATGDPALFNGRAMTYYGRWTYKFEEAGRQGAVGALIIHHTDAAGYPWEVVASSWSGPQFGLVAEDANLSRPAVEGWLTLDAAAALFERAGLDLATLGVRAAREDFEAMSLGLAASLEIRNTIERSTSHNVVGRLTGTDRPGEAVVYMAHWDHLGKDETLEGDEIYNGALDNATGVAGLIEIAAAFGGLERPPARTVLFLAVTAEEQGLLGSDHYGEYPVHPLDRTVAAINMDGLNTVGPMNDITVVGLGNSDLDDYLEAVVSAAGRVIRADPEPEKGFFYRSDHFNFAKRGVPALYTDSGIDHVERGETYGRRMREAYTAERYHKPTDEYDPSWDLDGAVDDLRLLFDVGYSLAQGAEWPNWRDGNEFRAARDQMMEGAGGGD